MITYEQIQKANESIHTTDIKGKEYAEVHQRVKAFRQVYPTGFIMTDLMDDNGGKCVFKAVVGYNEGEREIILGTGTAYEREDSTFINKTSYIENCETSAVGRALGFAGFGIDTSIASAEEVGNAIANQGNNEKKATPKQLEILKKTYVGELLDKLLAHNNISKLEDLSMAKASELIKKLSEKEAK